MFTGLRPGESEGAHLRNRQLRPSIEEVSYVLRPAPSADLLERVAMLEEVAIAGDDAQVIGQLRRLASAQPVKVPALPASALAAASANADDAHSERVACPKCSVGGIHRSKARNIAERVRKHLTAARLYRCDQCSWRGWILPMAGIAATPVDDLAPPISRRSTR